jgi:hypothetical protein
LHPLERCDILKACTNGKETALFNPAVGQSTQFTAINQPHNNGRKPSKLRKYIKDNNLSAIDIVLMVKQFYGKSREEIQDMAADPKAPIFISGIAKALLSDFLKGRVEVIAWLTDRGFGKAIEKLELSGRLDITQWTPEQRKARIEELKRKENERETKSKVV